MDDETITVRCVCGWETSGPEDVAVEATAEHGRRMHNMTPTRDEVLAMAVAKPGRRDILVE
jgi:predicted small metal-binding protein